MTETSNNSSVQTKFCWRWPWMWSRDSIKSNGEVKGSAWFFICALILFVAAAFVPKSWSSPMCPTEVIVSEFSTKDRPHYYGASVSEAYNELDKESPFLIFANDAEAALLEAVRKNLCSPSSPKAPISVEIMFIRFGLSASELEINRFQTALTGMKGSYADVTVDQAGRAIKAKIIWNPRRILRDQLTLDGYKFSEDTPLLPFLNTEFYEFIELYSAQVVHNFSGGAGDMRAAAFKGTVPSDMYGLIIRSGRTDRVPFGGIVKWTLRDLIDASLPGYSAMTKAAIKRAFESGSSKHLHSVLDAQSQDIQSLYRMGEWISRVWTGRIKPFEPMEHGK